jgi:outer membrane protein
LRRFFVAKKREKMIRKIVFIAFAIIIAFSASAQIEKGKILVGGRTNMSFTSVSLNEEFDGSNVGEMKTQSFEFSPEIGYFVMDGFAIGANISYRSVKGKIGDGDWSDPSRYTGVSAFGKYYLDYGQFKPFGMAKLGFMAHSEGTDDADKYRGLALGVGVGGAYFVTESIAFEAGLVYDYTKFKNKEESKYVVKQGQLAISVGVVVAF